MEGAGGRLNGIRFGRGAGSVGGGGEGREIGRRRGRSELMFVGFVGFCRFCLRKLTIKAISKRDLVAVIK